MRMDKLTVKAQEAIQAAQSLADQGNHQAIEPEHLLLALLQQQEGVVGPLLGKLGARPEALAGKVRAEVDKLPAVRGGGGRQYASPRFEGMINRAREEAERLKDEYVSTEHLLIAIAQEKGGVSARLLAAAGVTPEAIYRSLVEVRGSQRVTDPNPEDKYQALQRYSKDLTEQARKGQLKPALARGELRWVGATTVDEYRKHIEKDPALERRFQPVMVREPSVEDTIAILRGLKEKYEVHHKVKIKDAALVAAAVLSHRYITDRFLPDKAIDLIDEAASRLRIEIDSMPHEIDEIERRIMQLQIERVSVARESDALSKERLARLDAELK